MRFTSIVTAFLVVPCLVAILGAQPHGYAFTVDDLLSLERPDWITVGWLRLAAAALSADGQWLALVVDGRRASFTVFPFLAARYVRISWIVSAEGARPFNATRGGREGRGYCRWMSLRDGFNAGQVYLGDRQSNQLKRTSERGTEIGYTEIASPKGEAEPLVWKDKLTW